MRRALSFIAAAVIAALISGCAGLPTSSGVQARQAITDAPTAPPANVEFDGPQPDASPEEIVHGFLRANASVDEDYGVAREFLTPQASRKWTPSGRVAINQGERDFSYRKTATARIQVTANQIAELDAGGHLRQSAQPTSRVADIQLAKVGGQWRISALPADFGPYMSISDFRDRTYAPYTVYLAERRTHTLVADQQWFPRNSPATALARAVLRGAPEWVARPDGSAPDLNDLPGGTRLAVDAVPVSSDGIATVDLTTAVRTASPDQRAALWAAMMATLNQVPKVRRVNLTVGGARLEAEGKLPPLPDQPITPADVGFTNPQPSNIGVATRTGQRLVWRTEVNSPKQPDDTKAALPVPKLNKNWYLLASSSDATQFAAISGDRSSLGRWSGGGQPYVVPKFGRQLTRPSFDYLDEIWVAGIALSNSGPDREVSSGAAVWMLDAKQALSSARPQAISAPWLGSSQIISLKVAHDGQRVALITRTPKGVTQLSIAFVIRDANGNATALASPTQVGQAVTDVKDVGWLDDVTLAVIGRVGATGQQQIIEVPLSGFVNPLGPVIGAQQVIATGRGTGDIFVVTNKPGVQERVGGGWSTVGEATDVVAPGT